MLRKTKLIFALSFFISLGCTAPTKKTTKKKDKVDTAQTQVPSAPGSDEPFESSEIKEEEQPVKTKAKIPRVGLILGPGGLKTFAHIGVLKEFEKSKIPIEAIVGLEMGAMVGAFYSLAGSGNETEWKLFKLKEDEIFEKSFFQTNAKVASVPQLMDFIKRELGQKNHEAMKIPFSCMTFSMKQEKALIKDNGNVLQSIRSCLPYPPLFKVTGDTVAAVTHIKKAADFLKEQGIDVVVLVNVISQGRVLKEEEYLQQPALANLWIEIRKQLREAEQFVSYTINVDTKDFPLTEFEMRRAFVQMGGNDGRYHINILANKFGF